MPVLGAVSPHVTGRVHLHERHTQPASQSAPADCDIQRCSFSLLFQRGPGQAWRWEDLGSEDSDTPSSMSVSSWSPPRSGLRGQCYLVSEEVPQHQQAVAAPGGDGHGDLHHHPMDREQAQVLDLWPRAGRYQCNSSSWGSWGENEDEDLRGQPGPGASNFPAGPEKQSFSGSLVFSLWTH